MKILCTSLWDNSWIPYWTKYLESRGHEVRWLVNAKCSYAIAKNHVEWCDVVLCHWAVGWSVCFSNVDIKKPIFVIHRSFEVFEETRHFGKVTDNTWSNVTRLFMLNESHFQLFNTKVKNIQPTFIKNGVDVDYWKKDGRKANHNLAWIANINHKKGEMLAVHAVAELSKIDPLMQMYHLGRIQSTRIELYIKNILPHLKSTWFSYGWVEGSAGVKIFLKDKRYVLCSSLVEGHPMNILEAMSMGCQPLIHRYPGVEHQFPEKWIWTDFDDLKRMFQEEYKPEEYRQYVVDNYDYRKVYEPVALAIEDV